MAEPALLVLIGTKAQFIKTAPVLRELDARGIGYRLVYTGQHSETFDLLEAAFGTRPPDDILVPGFEAATHRSFFTWCWLYWRSVVKRIRSGGWHGTRIGLVHGDTASTLFGAITARWLGARVGHIEAGLRSPRLFEPFPEEIIRRMVSRLSALHFVPDEDAASNLSRARGLVVSTHGNTLRDALAMALDKMDKLPAQGGSGGYAIVSMHRNENLSSDAVFDLLMEEVLRTASLLPVKFVLHPATREKLRVSGWLSRLQSVRGLELLERMDYPDFVRLLVECRFLMTDGGSNQEEAAMLGLPTLLLRRATERQDGVGGNVILSNLQRDVIREFVAKHVDGCWVLRRSRNEGSSPSSQLVDALQAALAG
jgi:UDP-N-acetylglucosamine 2-epimerase (non-hydrolysing)